ncbi:hypothetical protein AA0118_g12115 [Alternaria tenuissima]|nr:hypothetical protein AA0118_g12115 [Alternaria tenuissima]
MANKASQSFRFLDLPAELRIMIYKLMPNYTFRTRYVKRNSNGDTTSSFTIIRYTAPTAMLATCKMIKDEVEAIILKTRLQIHPIRVDESHIPLLGSITPRIEADARALYFLGAEKGPVNTISEWYSRIQTNQHTKFEAAFPTCTYDICSLLTKHGYVMEGGTLEEAARSLVNFVRKSGYYFHIRREGAAYNRILAVALTKGASVETGTTIALDTFGNSVVNRTASPKIFLVAIHTLSTVSAQQESAVRRGIDINLQKRLISGCLLSSPQFFGASHTDKRFKETHDKFWTEGEWDI